MYCLLTALISLNIGILIGIFISRVFEKNRYKEYELEAKAKADLIKSEAQKILQKAKEDASNITLNSKQIEEILQNKEKKANKKLLIVEEKEIRLEELLDQKEKITNKLIEDLSKVSGLTKNEAKELILKEHKKQLDSELAAMSRKAVVNAKEKAKKFASTYLAEAVTRYAGEFAGERLINTIKLPSDDDKGKIIGKEGRNIKTLEQLLGVDIIIDETPGVILVSNFNLYRRSIAVDVIKRLIEDGRIHPGRIEEIHQKVIDEFEDKIYQEGEKIVVDLGLFPMHEELIKLIGRLRYRASYGQNALLHSLEVARLSKVLAAEMGGDEKLALRAGLLHDIGKALTQDFGGNHVDLGADVCRKYGENRVVINAIYAHHEHEKPISVESAAVCAADVLSAARPGARREVLESFTRRVKELENIALEEDGVMQAYAINAGREIRVFIDADKISDEELPYVTHKIAENIEKRLKFPGDIKVNAIRQLQSIIVATNKQKQKD